ncbi:hypothetical protein NP493_335g03056 [Ridgeia piscesae]|uniref:Uncharacterized protein n=1 Tax=Ridgeia piscesae TaxID=27915 RepID=A0AAD9L3Q0_RIDPI|nr:hypothetical protein NP493_335g03056 [Ridgeia piscesae]
MFKICAITNQALSYKQPSYLHSLLNPVRKPVELRSFSLDLRFIPKVNTSIGSRAFAVGASTLCNMLPSIVLNKLKILLKILPSFKDIPLQPCLSTLAPWRINQSDDN